MDVRAVLGREAEALWAGGKGSALVAAAIGWGLLIGTRMVYPVVFPSLQDAYGLSLTTAGLLVTVLWFFGSIGQLPGGVLADRYSERAIMAASTVVVAVALGFVVTASSPVVLFAATALWGTGQSLYPVARITLLSRLYPDRLGSALGVVMASGDVGQTVLPPIAAFLTATIAWQVGLGFASPLLLLVGILLFVTLPAGNRPDGGDESRAVGGDDSGMDRGDDSRMDRGDDSGTDREDDSRADGGNDSRPDPGIPGVLAGLRTPAVVFSGLILFLYLFVWQSFTTFYPTYLITVKGLSPTVASVLFGSFFAVGVVVKPVVGAAYDRIGVRGTLVGVLLPPVAGFVLLPLVDGLWPLVAVTALVSTILGSGTITQTYLVGSFSDEMQGTGLGVVRTLASILGSTGPVVFGAVADYGYFDEGYVALAVVVAAAVLLSLRMPRG